MSDWEEKASARIPESVKKEYPEPVCGSAPLPLWLIAVSGVVVFFAAFYLGLFNGGFRGDVFDERESSPALLFPEKAASGASLSASAAVAEVEDPAVRGKKYYMGPPASCVTCHQPTGKGVPGSFPPLAGSEYVQGGTQRLAMILLKGLQGPIKVQGGTFNGAMPAWEKILTDKQIAYVLTYVRQDWGNKAGAVTPEQIAAARKEFAARTDPWAEAELLAVPADKNLPEAKVAAPVAAPAAVAPEAKK